MTEAEKREATRQFCNKWMGKGREDEDDRSYWLDILDRILGVKNSTDHIEFQKKVIVDGNTKKIDAYIPETKVIIEQKSLGVMLDKKILQSGGVELTPYEQAKRYNDNLPYDEKARWIVTSNFEEIWIYDMNMRIPEPVKTHLSELPTKYSILDFLINREQTHVSVEMEISVKAGTLVGLIYDALYKQYIEPESDRALKSLNMLCVRLVFCLYAEDAGIFGTNHHLFHDYLQKYEAQEIRKALIELFRILDTKPEDRDPYDTSDLAKFPYVNGGLFADENIEIPHFTDEIKNILLSKASDDFDWSAISPTIFGAVFESTLNPETRRAGGMHYTSIENIHKVIDPLFLNDLKQELEEIKAISIEKTKDTKLKNFQNKIANIRWLDPACGSGNFLTETYISIRRLENEVLFELQRGQIVLGAAVNPIKVSISQFYGIEINDFAVTVAKTALWIAESQMMKETEDIVHMNLDFLPLKTNAYIVEGNALSEDWGKIIPQNELNYIMGNPPFVGARLMNEEQKADAISIFGKNWKNVGNLDYVCCWYKKCAEYIKNTSIRAALVSTNSVSQGENVANLWKPLWEMGIRISFAYRTFIWNSEALDKAKVHCVIIGFQYKGNEDVLEKAIYFEDNSYQLVKNINAYLIDADDVFIESRPTPLWSVPEIGIGNKPIDDGNYLFSKEEMEEFVKLEPLSKKYFKPWYGAKEFINNCPRYCLWLGACSPNELRNMPHCLERIDNVRKFRLESKSEGTRKIADTPTRFHVENMPIGTYIVIPETSSSARRYIPMGFMNENVLCSNAIRIMPDAGLYEFGILQSNVHMAWIRVVCGRLKSDYRYSKDVVYNNFPWPSPSKEQKTKIEQTAQEILNARELYSDSSLADLYAPLTMPMELHKAHIANDKAVMQAYGFNIKETSEADCVAALMKMYLEFTSEKR